MTVTIELTPDDYLSLRQDELIHKLYSRAVFQRIYDAVDKKSEQSLLEAEQFIHLGEEFSSPDIEEDPNVFKEDY